ncbi:MAG: cicA [Chlamydiales bacterium]|jgi:HAD superfamily hydrolase (TIGR01490 family)|nr:cicA [Chlamydiales bacterium]
MPAPKNILAAFDFDGTISKRDCLIYFFFYAFGKFYTLWNLLKLLPLLLAYQMGQLDRRAIKEKILSHFLKGKSIDSLRQLGAEFARGPLKRQLRKEALARINWHRQQGHSLIVISASTDLYLSAFAKEYGFQQVICSELELDAKNCLTGRLKGENCRGQEKVIRLLQEGPAYDYLFAYGDSAGDFELLQHADAPFLNSKPYRPAKPL